MFPRQRKTRHCEASQKKMRISADKSIANMNQMFMFLSCFQMLFLSFDTDRSGKMSSYELRIALKAAGQRSFCVVGI